MIRARLLSALSALFLCFLAGAQGLKHVSGHITDKTTGKPIDLHQVTVVVYGFNTVAAAEDVKRQMDGDENVFVVPDAQAFPDDNGYYEIPVAETGALIFKAEMKNAILEKVNFRLEINAKIEMGNYINTSRITATRDVVGVLDPQGDIEGNYLKARSTISLPAHSGKTNARMIVQPVLIDGGTGDTLRFLKPDVLDGTEYSLTQFRWTGYRKENDPLFPYISADTLSSGSQNISWADTIFLEDPSRNYQVKGIIQMEDYNRIYFRKDYFLASSRLRRPLRFLESSLEPYSLNADEYRERPKREKRGNAGTMSLTFDVGKSTLADDDTTGARQLDSVKSALLEIMMGEGSQLKEFHIEGTASPDGPYSRNIALAKARMEFALDRITSVLPKSVRSRVYMTTTAKVAPWTAVADLLEADSLFAESGAIRGIADRYSSSPDRQWAAVRALPYYGSIIKGYLPKLRSVRYRYGYELFRELTPEEIMERYLHDEDYRSGKKKFALYEYWHLFRMVKDPEELEALYLRAFNESRNDMGRPWILAASNLAGSYIARGVCDTSILSSFVDLRTPRTDFRIMRPDGNSYDIVNPEAVIGNQMIMYVMAGNFLKAGRLTRILPDTERNRKAISFALCLGGYYKGGRNAAERARARTVFETVSESSPRNKVVLALAMNTKSYDGIAEEAIAALPPEDALTDYFLAILYGRKGARSGDFMDDMASEDYLVSCFRKDPSFIPIAEGDGDIVESILKAAKDRYENE